MGSPRANSEATRWLSWAVPDRLGRLAATANAGRPRRISSTYPQRLPRAPTSTKITQPVAIHRLDGVAKRHRPGPLPDRQATNLRGGFGHRGRPSSRSRRGSVAGWSSRLA